MPYWLMKSEPDEVSIHDLERAGDAGLPWFGVRNYQARNMMRDAMAVGDLALFYHSGCPEPGIAGICRIIGPAAPDASQFDPASPYHDPRSDPAHPRWVCVTVGHVRTTTFVSLATLRTLPALATMTLLKRGNRLSITPVSDDEWRFLQGLLG